MVCEKCEKKLSKVKLRRRHSGGSTLCVFANPCRQNQPDKAHPCEPVRIFSCRRCRSDSKRCCPRLQVIVQDKWKDGARNTMEGGGRKVNENKALTKKKQWAPYSSKCTVSHHLTRAGTTVAAGAASASKGCETVRLPPPYNCVSHAPVSLDCRPACLHGPRCRCARPLSPRTTNTARAAGEAGDKGVCTGCLPAAQLFSASRPRAALCGYCCWCAMA